MKILTRIIVIFVCLTFAQPSYANPFAALKGLGKLFSNINDFFQGVMAPQRVSRSVRGLKDSEEQSLFKFGGDPYEDEKQWLIDDSACQKLEDEKNKYYCIVIKDQCSEESLNEKYGEARLLFGEGHFSLEPTTFEKCVNQLREKFKIGILPFDEELKSFQNFLTGSKSETEFLVELPDSVAEFEEMRRLKYKPQDITGDRLRISVVKILSSASETNEGNLEKVWSEVESELTEVINTIIKSSYDIDDVITNGFGKTRVPFYTQALVNKFKKVKISYSTEDLTKIELTELLQKKLDALVNDLNKVNEQIDKITGHTDPSAKTVLERLKVKREKIQEDIFNLKYALKDSND